MASGMQKRVAAVALTVVAAAAPVGAHASIFSSLFGHAARSAAKGVVNSAARNANARAALRGTGRRNAGYYWSDYTRYRKPLSANALKRMQRRNARANQRMQRTR